MYWELKKLHSQREGKDFFFGIPCTESKLLLQSKGFYFGSSLLLNLYVVKFRH